MSESFSKGQTMTTLLEEKFTSKTLILLYLGARVGEVDRKKMKQDLQKICLEAAKHGLIIPIDFKPYGDDLYSKRLADDLSWHQTIGLIEAFHEFPTRYVITRKGIDEIFNKDSVYYTRISEKNLEIIKNAIKIIEPTKKLQNYYETDKQKSPI